MDRAFFLAGALFALSLGSVDAQVAQLIAAKADQCDISIPEQCTHKDAIVFVHGIYGADDTFKNARTQFDWPASLPRKIDGRDVDVYKLNYQTALLAWARGSNPSFDQLALSVFDAMKPLRLAGYRSIGFIAHSLGGNVISTYVHTVKTALGHPQRSQNAFIITLATPVLGAQVADLASKLKSVLLMNDPLLESLERGNLYLTMLQQFREMEKERERRYRCRPVDLHAAVEEKYLGPLLIVRPDSAATPISNFVKSPIVGFPLDHSAIAKPTGEQSGVYVWAMERMKQEYQRISTWDESHRDAISTRRLCDLVDFIPETP